MPKITDARFKALSASAIGVPLEDFMKLTKIPIVLYCGDNIEKSSELVELPKVGLTGNSHFLMADLNNQEPANLMANRLHSKGLDT